MTVQPLFAYSPTAIITAIDNAVRFPEILTVADEKYSAGIATFKSLVAASSSAEDLLNRIRSRDFRADQRMTFLKIFRRAVSPVLDTEMAKRLSRPTEEIIEAIGGTFKAIATLQQQFANMTPQQDAALAALIGENDTRGQLGYMLTDRFFDWFERTLGDRFSIDGPRGAGRDVELSSIYSGYSGRFPCDFVIRSRADGIVRAIGFARYDSTRGGSQSDDRTAGNADKVSKARAFCEASGNSFKLVFLSDGPGLAHRDTWDEACSLDGSWNGNVRVTTLRTCEARITSSWLMSTSGGVVEVP